MDGINAIKYIVENNIEGSIVNCGIESGNLELVWLNELLKSNVYRDIYMYDTFSGLVEPGEYDYTCENASQYKMNKEQVYNTWKNNRITNRINGWSYTPLVIIQDRLNSTGYPKNNLHYIVGDLMETLKDKTNIPEKISILRLNTNWYKSSKYELEEMYDNVVIGGVIIFDDYYHWDGQRRATDDFFKNRNINNDFVKIDDKSASIIKK